MQPLPPVNVDSRIDEKVSVVPVSFAGNPAVWGRSCVSPIVTLGATIGNTVDTYIDTGIQAGQLWTLTRFAQYFKSGGTTYHDCNGNNFGGVAPDVQIDIFNNADYVHDGSLVAIEVPAFFAYSEKLRARIRRLDGHMYHTGVFSCPQLCWTAAQFGTAGLFPKPSTFTANMVASYPPVTIFFGSRVYFRLTRLTAFHGANQQQLAAFVYGPMSQSA